MNEMMKIDKNELSIRRVDHSALTNVRECLHIIFKFLGSSLASVSYPAHYECPWGQQTMSQVLRFLEPRCKMQMEFLASAWLKPGSLRGVN